MIISFILLGIGNTLLQVSLNPLMANIVSANKMSSALTFGQFIKSIAAFLAPLIAAWAAISLSNWRVLLFPIYSGICLLAIIYLASTKIDEQKTENSNATFKDCFRLLSDSSILLFFIGIMTHVGLDVGINTTAPKLLMQKAGMSFTVYPESHHGFDSPTGQVQHLTRVPNGQHPGLGVHAGRNPVTGPQAWLDVQNLLKQRWSEQTSK